MTRRSLAWAQGRSSASGPRSIRLYFTWLDRTGAPRPRSACCQWASEKLLTPTWRTSPSRWSLAIADIVAFTGTSGLCQCTW